MALSAEQRGLLVRLQEACRVIGAHDNCALWSLLGCSIEAGLVALDIGGVLAAVHRAELKAYLLDRATPDLSCWSERLLQLRRDIELLDELKCVTGIENKSNFEHPFIFGKRIFL